jgi:hypothetical protein
MAQLNLLPNLPKTSREEMKNMQKPAREMAKAKTDLPEIGKLSYKLAEQLDKSVSNTQRFIIDRLDGETMFSKLDLYLTERGLM